ncbi:complement C1q-like protein 2 isoform X1 [Astatotilapia calliptera]|uniref:Complement C1q-like protein 2 n=2 Tax=Haplochromini TaxID=319058 RepID=A0A3Q2WD64_HAPBU|nr:complement C1q-like protein 2 isoform X1 [Haplochromis burtoni]XP_026000841.1 complement C1q-like protein 2 isoform X1 [Astatotilapia calliptera]XP_039861604.1 complement C1q-like protein 2 [Simochromis diagramma]XP_042083833.1 complement C1q-like protein 2 isoform X2 [Haplochromis burtoni]
MKSFAVLILAIGSCLCDSQIKSDCDKICDVCSFTRITQDLGAVGEKVTNIADKITLLEIKLQKTEKEVMDLQKRIGGIPQVAFSVALLDSGFGNTGPFDSPTPLRYKNIFSNTGSGYNPSTGIFTAMTKGMYFFRFSMFNNLNSVPNSVVSLMKNGKRLTSVWDTSGSDANDMGSNAVVIPLEVGDNVYVELQANRIVYDDSMNYNTFSGFLLFTL